MNIFYAPPSQINNGFIELLDQEANHASRVMRAREGDPLVVVDGRGGRYEGTIRRITKKSMQIEIDDRQQEPLPKPRLTLGLGIIKKRDRLEFAIEKATELAVVEIMLFRSDHSVKQNVRMDRLEAIAISAMKQSLRSWLPDISVYHSLEKMIEVSDYSSILAAHEEVKPDGNTGVPGDITDESMLLLVGPEGGFSDDEIALFKDKKAQLISLGSNRLRAETAAVAFLSQFL
jgi:16S rRNA (uracil1498-N3)-methyltransferase